MSCKIPARARASVKDLSQEAVPGALHDADARLADIDAAYFGKRYKP